MNCGRRRRFVRRSEPQRQHVVLVQVKPSLLRMSIRDILPPSPVHRTRKFSACASPFLPIAEQAYQVSFTSTKLGDAFPAAVPASLTGGCIFNHDDKKYSGTAKLSVFAVELSHWSEQPTLPDIGVHLETCLPRDITCLEIPTRRQRFGLQRVVLIKFKAFRNMNAGVTLALTTTFSNKRWRHNSAATLCCSTAYANVGHLVDPDLLQISAQRDCKTVYRFLQYRWIASAYLL